MAPDPRGGKAASQGPRSPHLLSFLLAVPGALLWAVCFAPDGRLVLPWVALAPLILLVGRPAGPAWGFLHGLVFWLASIPWIAPTLAVYGELGMGLGIGLLALLAAYLGAYHAAFVWLAARIERRTGASGLLVAGPAIWVSLEIVRTFLLGGFPWNVAGYAWVDVPGALRASAWIGALGISYAVVFSSTGVALAWRSRRWEPLAAGALLPLLLLSQAERWEGREDPEPEPPRRVAIVQPNTPILAIDDVAAIRLHYRRLLEQTAADCPEGGLVVWPESAAWPYSFQRDPDLALDLASATRGRCSVLLNSARFAGDDVYNSAYLVAPDGSHQVYDKRHLVPFGEYVPFSGLLPFVDTLARNAGRFAAGRDVALLDWRGERLGVSICFEIIFGSEVAASVREGATVLATITNDAWYGDTWAPWQHLRAARFRAAESARPVLRAALTGVSAVIAPDGSLRQSLGVGEAGTLDASVRGSLRLTPYTRHPWALPTVLGLIAASAILAPRRRR